MKKAMLSQPMAGKTDEEIREVRNKATEHLRNENYEVINTIFIEKPYYLDTMERRGVVQFPVAFLARSIDIMSQCHVVYFCKGWEDARGCKIEHEIAVAYGLEIIYEI